jgi:hypothetical protein
MNNDECHVQYVKKSWLLIVCRISGSERSDIDIAEPNANIIVFPIILTHDTLCN